MFKVIVAAAMFLAVYVSLGADVKFVTEYIYPTSYTITTLQGGNSVGPSGVNGGIPVISGGRSSAVVQPGAFQMREVGVSMSVSATVAEGVPAAPVVKIITPVSTNAVPKVSKQGQLR